MKGRRAKCSCQGCHDTRHRFRVPTAALAPATTGYRHCSSNWAAIGLAAAGVSYRTEQTAEFVLFINRIPESRTPRRYQYEQLYNDICRRSRPLVSCVRSDQPPRYQDTQPIARLAGGSLQSKTTCSSKSVGWNLAFIPRPSCLHEGSTRAVQNSDLAALGQTANKLPINSPCQ
jgi:hypothetical protein